MYQTEWLRHVVGKLVPMKYIESLVPKYGKIYEIMIHYIIHSVNIRNHH